MDYIEHQQNKHDDKSWQFLTRLYYGEDIPDRRMEVSSDWNSKVSGDIIASKFGIVTKKVQATLKMNMQRGVGSDSLPIIRSYRTDSMYQKNHLNGKFDTDTLFTQLAQYVRTMPAKSKATTAGSMYHIISVKQKVTALVTR